LSPAVLRQPTVDLGHVVLGSDTEAGGHLPSLSADFTPLVLNFFLSGGGGGVLLTHRHFIPAAAYAAGAEGAFFQTDVDVKNTGDTAERYRFLWLPRGESNADPLASGEFVLGGGMGARYANSVHELFGLEPDALGAIAIEASSPNLLFTSRTYNLEPGGGGGTFGQAMPAIPAYQMLLGGERRHIVFASEGADYRTNIGCQNGDRAATVVNLELFDQQGTSLEVVSLLLNPWSNDQLNRVFADYAPVHGSVEVSALLATSQYYCYGSIIDNVTNDPTTILPQ